MGLSRFGNSSCFLLCYSLRWIRRESSSYIAVGQQPGADFIVWGPSTLLRATSTASRRSLGKMRRVTMAIIANSNAKSGVRYKSPSGCIIDNGKTVQNEVI